MEKWIGYTTDKEYSLSREFKGVPATYIIRKISIKEDLKRAIISISSLGVYTLFVNGELASNDFMAPGWTEYSKTVEYLSYDITKFLKKGENVLGFVVCDGWYASCLSDVGKNVFGDYPLKLWYELELGYTDCNDFIKVDGTEMATDGAIRYSDNQQGIYVDNTKELKEFSKFGIEKEYSPVEVFDMPRPTKAILPAGQEIFRFPAKPLKTQENRMIVDFGQNFAGVIDCTFKGKRGSKIVIRHAEALEGDELFTATLRGAPNIDTYVLAGEGEERFFPRSVFHGFRYAEISWTEGVEVVKIEGVAISSAVDRTGYFSCSSELVNKIYSNVLWGQRGNFLSIPTDCPQRDERLGWTGDAQIFCKTAMLNYDCKNFYKKYLRDIRDSVSIYGKSVPLIVPFVFQRVWPQAHGRMGWSDAVILIPYEYYLAYGDIDVLKENLDVMKGFISFVSENNELIVKGDSFSDWLSVMEVTDSSLYDTAYYAYSTKILSEICELLNDADSIKYRALFEQIKTAFRNEFYIDGKLKGDTQTSYVLAYSFGLISKEEAKDNLLRKLEQFNWHLTTGFHGTKYLLPMLCEIGCSDVAFKILLNTQQPSWGYMVECGATTIWERWDSFTKGVGFNPNGMNSLNHYSLGSCGEWLYTHVLGINVDKSGVGYKKAIIRPYFDERMQSASGSIKTEYGNISVRYTILDNVINFVAEVDDRIDVSFDFQNTVISSSKNGNEYKFELFLKEQTDERYKIGNSRAWTAR